MARPERFELPTTWFEARYSIQLSYGRVLWGTILQKGDSDLNLLFLVIEPIQYQEVKVTVPKQR
jgi:hypothetical protein